MSAPIYFEFLSSVWDQLPGEDREAFAELWHGYEQVIAAVYQKALEVNLNIAVNDLLPWTSERWLPYEFNSSNFLSRPATLIANQDLSVGINLTSRRLLKLQVDNEDPFEIDVRGAIPVITKIDEIIKKINIYAKFKFASSLYENTILKLTSRLSGPGSSITVHPTSPPSANACEFVLGVDPETLPARYPVYKYPYTLVDKTVSSIPELRDAVREESVTKILYEGIDYIVSPGEIAFKEIPPPSMWAEISQLDEENPWNNYGYLTDIYQKNSERYVDVLRGLWFALWNGPKVTNLRISLYLLFGLPVASEAGIVTALSVETPGHPGSITMLGDSGAQYTYPIPVGLEAEVALGERVYQFQPLTTGINVFDKVNYPGFIEKEVGREGVQRFLTENATTGQEPKGSPPTDETRALRMLEEYTFLPQISVESFVYPDINMKNVMTFLEAFRPLNKTYLFQIIVGIFKDPISLNDSMAMDLDVDLTSNLDVNETTYLTPAMLDDYETTPESGLDLDPATIAFDEELEIEVWGGSVKQYDPVLQKEVWVEWEQKNKLDPKTGLWSE